MKRVAVPPPMEFFERARRPGGEGRLRLAIGDVGLDVRGLDDGLAATLRDRFSAFVADDEADLPLQVAARADDADYFIEPPQRAAFNRVVLACDGRRIRFVGHQVAGWFETAGGRGEMILARGDYERPERAVENYIRAAIAWQAAERGGALVHGASAVLDGRGYLFFGPSGAGKSTLSACNRRARVVSDDLSLVLPDADGRPQLVGSPFRGTYEEGGPVLGRFPLVAAFRIVQDVEASVRPAPRLQTLGELVGQLPFVAEAFGRRPDLFRTVEAAFAGLPLAHLHFRKDESYWDAIAAADLPAPR